MLKVKNNYQSHLGFGTERILPGETKPLPKGFDENHPVVKFYISKGWLKVIGGGAKGGAASVNVGVNLNTGDGDNGAGDGDNGAGGADNGGTSKPIDRMNKEELQALAFERGVEFADSDTKQVLIEKIKAAQTGDE